MTSYPGIEVHRRKYEVVIDGVPIEEINPHHDDMEDLERQIEKQSGNANLKIVKLKTLKAPNKLNPSARYHTFVIQTHDPEATNKWLKSGVYFSCRLYAPVVRIEHVRMLFALAVLNFPIIQLDAKNAFLNGKSDFSIYVQQPDEFVDTNFPDHVLLLLKSLYGLKQASRIWYLTLYEAIVNLGFSVSEFDPCIFISTTRNLMIAVYVDDILAIGPQSAFDEFARQLNEKFRIVNQGPVSSFLGINVECKNGTILLNQIGYINKMAQRFQINPSSSVPTPLEHSLPLVKPGKDDKRPTGGSHTLQRAHGKSQPHRNIHSSR
jgi:Reverse transcriptase (RNA-dependent DNA polymerase)